MTIRLNRLALLAGAGAALAACGGDGQLGRQGGEPSDASATPAATTRPAGQAADAAKVRIDGFEYLPPTVTVRAGGRVVVTNDDVANHTVTFARAGATSIPNIRPGEKRAVRVERPGRFAYVCEFHPTMRGVVVAR